MNDVGRHRRIGNPLRGRSFVAVKERVGRGMCGVALGALDSRITTDDGLGDAYAKMLEESGVTFTIAVRGRIAA